MIEHEPLDDRVRQASPRFVWQRALGEDHDNDPVQCADDHLSWGLAVRCCDAGCLFFRPWVSIPRKEEEQGKEHLT